MLFSYCENKQFFGLRSLYTNDHRGLKGRIAGEEPSQHVWVGMGDTRAHSEWKSHVIPHRRGKVIWPDT